MDPLTKIICTLGPATQTAAQIMRLKSAGMNIARINLSHGSRVQHTSLIKTIKTINKTSAEPLGILLDTKGGEIRTGDVKSPIAVKKGEEVIFSPHELTHEKYKVIHVNYDGFAQDVRETDRILLDNGELSFAIVSIQKNGAVLARANQGGIIGSRRHVNLPGADLDVPSITKKDWNDLAFAIKQDIDFVALSFIRTAEDIEEVRSFFKKKRSDIELIAKIETAQAVENIQEIIRVSDGIMVARGDLGAEIPFERLPAIQDAIVSLCRDAGKPVIVATHMLESMKEHAIPTRAEITDVAHAAITQTDATMLSGETASGKNPLLAVEAMSRILVETERNIAHFIHTEDNYIHDEREARAEAAVRMAESLGGLPIVVFTRTGRTAQTICKFRPSHKIIAFTPTESRQRKLALRFGVIPLLLPFKEDPEKTLETAFRKARDCRLLSKKEKIVLVSDAKTSLGSISTVQVRQVP
ncbi:pyruvate kinase [Candidatus Peribacteria bacterium RIFCSPHIGHO2_01_FULL_51_9]|nr:MAG: pyruvate kinase [Candidatus Peribacteria bacterium RIFCSPHIGHO2_01_FULL_51_9]